MASLAPRSLRVMNTTDALVRKMPREEVKAALEGVTNSYRAAGAAAAFEWQVVPLESPADELLWKWIVAH